MRIKSNINLGALLDAEVGILATRPGTQPVGCIALCEASEACKRQALSS